MISWTRFGRATLVALGLLSGSLTATSEAQEPTAEQLQFYENRIRPLLRTKCWSCHGALAQHAGLRLDTVVAMRLGGDSGPAIVTFPDSSGATAANGSSEPLALSLMQQRVREQDPDLHMPQEGTPLDESQLADLDAWLALGAPAPANEIPELDPNEHWAFRVPQRLPTPDLSAAGELARSSRGPIDAFVLQRLIAAGLSPAGEVAGAALLRRVTLDLTGLPPTVDELRQFVADPAPDAYERTVDRLLASPAHGERWARHWMDVWRYADWHGRRMVPDVWNSAPQIWRWRDWIVDSSNQDLGYGPMVERMLAADEIAPADPQSAVATGYLIRNWYALNPNDWMRANVEHTARAFLGLSLQCAHCHDHKYDPLTQDDYFAFRAIFEPIGIRQDPIPGGEDPGAFQEYDYSVLRRVERRGMVSIFDRSLDAPTWRYSGGDERNRDEARGPIAPALPVFLAPSTPSISAVELPVGAWYPGLNPVHARASLEAADRKIASQRRHLEQLETREQELREAVARQAETRAKLERLIVESRFANPSFAIRGERSLWIDAREGRRILQRSLAELTQLVDGTEIEFRVRLLTDRHFNMQLAKDAAQGLTAGSVGFAGGRIVAYRPGGFDEFEIGRYDFAAGETEFLVRWRLFPSRNAAQLEVSDPAEEHQFASAEVAINDWNPIDDPNRPLTFDIRNGQLVLLDDLVVTNPTASGRQTELRIEFEQHDDSSVPEGADITDIAELTERDSWFGSFLDQPGAAAIVMSVPIDGPIRDGIESWRQALALREGLEIEQQALEAELELALAERDRLQTVLAAESARYAAESTHAAESGSTAFAEPLDLKELTRRALQAEQLVTTISARTAVTRTRRQLAMAIALPTSDATRLERIATARKAVDKAKSAGVVAEAPDSEKASADETSTAGLTPLSRTYPRTSSGRRRALAEWITSPDNPLAARVAVNHVWSRHLVLPLVDTVDDFGRNGAPPTHPELLDALSVELLESGWSLKRLHRKIVCSATYRRDSASSAAQGDAQRIDPEARLLWRRSTGRMEAEVVRDSLLSIAERLDRRMGGEEFENSAAFASLRRSLYFSCQPEGDGRSEFGALFDAPDPLQCYRRTRTVMPQQALALTNSELVHDLSRRVAERLWLEIGLTDDRPESSERQRRFVASAFETVLGRLPLESEAAVCLEFLSASGAAVDESAAAIDGSGAEHNSATVDPDERQRAGLIRVLWNHHEFVTIR